MRPHAARQCCDRGTRLQCYATARSTRSQRIRRPVVGPRPPDMPPASPSSDVEQEVDASGKPRWLRCVRELLSSCAAGPTSRMALQLRWAATDCVHPRALRRGPRDGPQRPDAALCACFCDTSVAKSLRGPRCNRLHCAALRCSLAPSAGEFVRTQARRTRLASLPLSNITTRA